MRKILVNAFVTLDGVMQAPGGPEEDPSGGFEHGGWSFYYWDDVMRLAIDDLASRPFDLLLGRRTYEIFAAHWPGSDEEPVAEAFNRARKYVASRTLGALEWRGSVLLGGGDVGRAVAELKREAGPELHVWGSAGLLQTLQREDLLDEYRIWTFPVVIGRGKRLFKPGAGGRPAGLRVTESRVSSTGVVMATYEREGPLRCGSLAPEKPSPAELARRERMATEESRARATERWEV